MFKVKRLLHIHIILIYFTYLCSQGHSPSSYKQVHASEGTSPATTTDSDGMTKEERAKVLREFAAQAQERLFGHVRQSHEPTNSNTKLFVPSAMLREYIGYREEVREFVPDDRDFFGKINIDDLDSQHTDIWSRLSNNGKSDILVDMGEPDDRIEERKFHVDGRSDHIGYIALQDDPEVVPPRIEPLLPPHARTIQAQRRFVSVHLKFNLSQEIYSKPTAADSLRGAELRLTRGNIHACEFSDCPKKPIPFFSHNKQDGASSSSVPSNQEAVNNNDELANRIDQKPRYLKVYVLQVNGYDRLGEPLATILVSRRVETNQDSPLFFNIKPIVKNWLIDPKSNHGIIVRVTSDDPDYDAKALASGINSRSRKRETNSTSSANETDAYEPFDPLDHVRLKRAFHSASDKSKEWDDQKPSLLIYTDTTEESRCHVKRHYEDDGEMQADEPDKTTQFNQQTPPSTTTPSEININSSMKPSLLSTVSGSQGKRDQMSPINTRRAPPPGRASSTSGRASSSSQGASSRPKSKGRPSVKQSDKCSKRLLNINFDEVGWSSWIIAPHSYYANYCAGDCNWPLTDAQNSTNHAIVQSIYRSAGRLVPKSCCAPIKYGRMAILYQLDGMVQMRQYDDMIVEACGCL